MKRNLFYWLSLLIFTLQNGKLLKKNVPVRSQTPEMAKNAVPGVPVCPPDDNPGRNMDLSLTLSGNRKKTGGYDEKDESG